LKKKNDVLRINIDKDLARESTAQYCQQISFKIGLEAMPITLLARTLGSVDNTSGKKYPEHTQLLFHEIQRMLVEEFRGKLLPHLLNSSKRSILEQVIAELPEHDQ
jgi:hypothetical protein